VSPALSRGTIRFFEDEEEDDDDDRVFRCGALKNEM
jgi:hypothetical protein